MNCIVIDDEPIARQGMTNLISRAPQLHLKGIFRNAGEAALFLAANQVDLLFLDIQMPGVNGLHFARSLPLGTMVIFTTAHTTHALESYEVNAVDYLTKPINEHRFFQAVEKAARLYQLSSGKQENENEAAQEQKGMIIRADRKFHNVLYQDILFVEGLKDYVIIHLQQGKKLITAMNVKTIHSKLPDSLFRRISKSFIINKRHVTSMDNRNVYINEHALPVGEIYRDEFKKDCLNDPLFSAIKS
ncbi:response regulator transcription factor [Pseudoflavitalea sp. G-6-1-2]|uniref:LytR/AlgR family response regulator transcription factor n=1 Tax=Pseudoflavitalea sp. G-6-1-2 TaxID=2728841 RepID=UPI00146A7B04|nr:LytTR family DNA-binding domain-containing protein [Pseudoflavitalea sp. G-6-1-2]NML22631.1 response regulator transcription factor [Pseudoflavitalea sp. G-6-1-2]